MKLKLTLRDLFWLTLLAACFCAWWTDHRWLTAKYQNLETTIAEDAAKMKIRNADRRKRATELFGVNIR